MDKYKNGSDGYPINNFIWDRLVKKLLEEDKKSREKFKQWMQEFAKKLRE